MVGRTNGKTIEDKKSGFTRLFHLVVHLLLFLSIVQFEPILLYLSKNLGTIACAAAKVFDAPASDETTDGPLFTCNPWDSMFNSLVQLRLCFWYTTRSGILYPIMFK